MFGNSNEWRFVFGDVELYPRLRRVVKGGRPVRLTKKEYELLMALAEREGAPMSHAELRRVVWSDRITEDSRTLAQHVAELRRKLERDARNPEGLVTFFGFGYALDGKWEPLRLSQPA